MNKMEASCRKHVLMLPFPAFGHVIPLLELARKISEFHDVTFAVSNVILTEMYSRHIVRSTDSIGYTPIVDGFIPETTFDPNSALPLIHIFKSVLPGIENLIATLPAKYTDTQDTSHPDFPKVISGQNPVDVVIIDEFISGVARACVEKNIPSYHFLTSSLRSMIYSLRIDDNYPTFPDNGKKEMLKEHQPGQPLQPVAEIIKRTYLKVNATLPFIQGVIVNSVKELEERALEELKKNSLMKEVELWFVGPLTDIEETAHDQVEIENSVLAWLDTQQNRSVVYVSFGSLAFPDDKQITDIFGALLTFGWPFIWSLPATCHKSLPSTMKSTLEDSRFIILKWAPQKLILSHSSTGVFISHCGWNGCLESLAGGVPILGWPMFAEQLINAKFLESVGVCILMTHGADDREKLCSANLYQSMVKITAVDSNGKSLYACRAMEWRDRIANAQKPGGSSHCDFQDLRTFDCKSIFKQIQ